MNRSDPFLLRLALVSGILASATPAWAWETDQFSERLVPIRDSLEAMNGKMNQELATFAQSWDRGAPAETDEAEVIERLVKQINGTSWLGKVLGDYERWVSSDPGVDRHSLDWPNGSIYGDAPASASHANWLMGSCATMVVAGVRMGTDKPGHFVSQGYDLYKEYAKARRAGRTEAQARATGFAYGRKLEETYFGLWISGVYSNADLVANAEGFRFYLELLRGPRPFLKWEGGALRAARAFDWRDYVSEYWDEALNPSSFSTELQAAVAPRLRALCGDYARDPASYRVPAPRDGELGAKYADLGLRPAPANRLDRVCGAN